MVGECEIDCRRAVERIFVIEKAARRRFRAALKQTIIRRTKQRAAARKCLFSQTLILRYEKTNIPTSVRACACL